MDPPSSSDEIAMFTVVLMRPARARLAPTSATARAAHARGNGSGRLSS
jgi:hypothetical protein